MTRDDYFRGPLPEADLRATVAAVEAEARRGAAWPVPRGARNSAITRAAERLGLTATTVMHRLRAAHSRLGIAPNGIAPPAPAARRAAPPPPPPPPSPAEDRAERQGAAFWRRKALAAEKALTDAEHLARELAGLRGLPWAAPD